jgi:hypothetical protein
MACETDSRRFNSPVLADRLEVFSMALFVVYAARVAAAMVPLRLLDTDWQLGTVSALLDPAAIPLLALGLLHLAGYLDPANPALGRRRDSMARLAILAVLGFLLLIPLQAFAAWNSVSSARASVSLQRTTANRNFAVIREAIDTATSVEDLQARLRSLESPSLNIRFETLGLPLSETKRRLRLRLSEAEEQLKTRISLPPPKAIEDVALNTLRVIASCGVFAAAFAIAAQRRNSEVPLLVEVMTLWSLRGTLHPHQPAGGGGPARLRRGWPGAHEADYFEPLAPEEEDPFASP